MAKPPCKNGPPTTKRAMSDHEFRRFEQGPWEEPPRQEASPLSGAVRGLPRVTGMASGPDPGLGGSEMEVTASWPDAPTGCPSAFTSYVPPGRYLHEHTPPEQRDFTRLVDAQRAWKLRGLRVAS